MGTPSRELKLFALGEPQIVTGAALIEPAAQVAFAAALYLILEARNPVSRRSLEEILWPTASTSQAGHRLRQTLLKLRRLGLEIESVGKSRLKLSSHEVMFDFEQWSPVNSDWRSRQLLPFGSYNPQISKQFSEWLESQRESIISVISHSILDTIARHRLAAEWVAVESWCTALLQIAPLNEEATLALAEALAMRGAKHAATRLLDEYLDETGTGPSDLRVQASLMRRRIADRMPPRPNHSADAMLVGRTKAMERLGEMLRSVKSKQTRVCLIVGDAGIGKSRVLSELAQFAALQGFTSVRVNVRPSHIQRPLSAFVELAPLLRLLPGAIGCSSETLRFLDLLTKHQPGIDSRFDSGDAAWTFGAVQTALFDLIDAVSDESPLLIQLEDVHWIDQSSADVLRELTNRLSERRVFFALTAREAPPEWQLSGPQGLIMLGLDPLDAAQSAQLVSSLLRHSGKIMEKRYLEWCVTVAEGNPYFLSELTNHWIETGIEHEVPPSLTAVLRRRISRLDHGALQVLQTCALLENNSTLPRIEAVLEYDAHELLANINSLGTAGMIVADSCDTPSSNAEQISTRHELLSNVAVNQLTSPARRFLHRRIGQVLESEIGEHYSAATLWDCAKHWQLAGDHRRAWHLATSCAAHLMKVGLPTAAADAYEKSLAFCSTDQERLEVLSALAVAYYRTSAWLNLRETVAKVRPLQRRGLPESSSHDDLELMDLRAQWQTLDWDTIITRTLACLHAETASAGHRCEAGVMALMMLGFQGEPTAMADVYTTIETLAIDPDVSEATKLQARMVFHTNSGDLEKAVIAARRLVIEQESRGEFGDLFRAFCNAAVTCRVAGLFGEASEFFSNALRIAKKHNLQAAEQRAIPLIANMALEVGNTGEALALYRRLCDLPLDPTNRFAFLERQALGERIALYEGRLQDARQLVPMSYEEAASDPIYHRRTYNLALYVIAEIAVTGNIPADAVRSLEDSFSRSRTGVHQAFGAFVLYAALRKAGKSKKATLVLIDYREKYRREPWPAPEHLLQTVLQNCGLS